MMSKVLEVSSSGFYKWLKTKPLRLERIINIEKKIKKEFDKSKGTYGSPRITLELKEKDITISKTTVGRRMNELKLTARPKKKYTFTTNSDHDKRISKNLLNRNFEVTELNTVWVSDITYIRVKQKWAYLTTVIDLADRMVVGWSLSDDMTVTNTVELAFIKAMLNRNISKQSGLMFHSDRGIQYASEQFREILKQYNCTQSMSRKGNCWDNAVAESFFKTIKIESLNKYIFNNMQMLNNVIFSYIDGWYNTVRKHSTLNGLSPMQMFMKKAAKLAA